MSALDAIKLYGSDDANSEEDFAGFDAVNEWEYKESFCLAASVFNSSNAFGEIDDGEAARSIFDGDNELADAVNTSNESIDSEGSYFQEEHRNKRKETKKVKRKAVVARNRRISHPPKLVLCGCRKVCSNEVSKNKRIIIHRAFWKLDITGQTAFFRERVIRLSIVRRAKHRHELKDPRKLHSYHYSLEMADKRVVRVCRKFFLNTLGYGEHCG